MLTIGDRRITLDDYQRVLLDNEELRIHPQALERIQKSHVFLETFHKDKIIYGINTGLGPMAQYRIDEADRLKLHYNAIRSHASGCGEPVDPVYVRSAMITLLNNFSHGFSGIHPEVPVLICGLINLQITPVVPEHGGVGASGDLVQLAHIALALIGEGEVFYQGKIVPTAEAFAQHNLKPISIHLREGLSLINGTCFMTGTGIFNLMHARNLIYWAVTAASMINEIVRSFDDYFSAELNQVKKHHGQNRIAELERMILHDSKLIRKREDHFFNGKQGKEYVIADKVQEYYSIRCVPQILGPILDTLEAAEKVLLDEANSSSDNPVIDAKNSNIFHGGNFHGDYVSFEMDKLKIAITKLSMLLERQINYLMNDKLNNKLPPFVNLGKLGVNFGMQGAQFTATSTVAENQTLSFPNYVHSISNNNDNQDIVSMGTNSAQFARKVIDNTYQVLSIELITLIQAIDYLSYEPRLSGYNREKYRVLRNIVPRFTEDTIKYVEIKRIKDYLCSLFIKIN
ncbi:MAG: aromatic amino acid lyase [Bacteroidales bacterium]|nr:aromatic amino acid lyase [Bacteroidales bacterium]